MRAYHVPDHMRSRRLEIRSGDQKIVVDHGSADIGTAPLDARARYRGGRVYLLIGSKALEMTTPVAAKVGHQLAANGGAALYLGGHVMLEIGGERFILDGEPAIQLGGVLVKKADRADDWQRGVQSGG